jgi:hypothetical protein
MRNVELAMRNDFSPEILQASVICNRVTEAGAKL